MLRKLAACVGLSLALLSASAWAAPGLVFRISTSMGSFQTTGGAGSASLVVPDTGAGDFLILCTQSSTAATGESISDNKGGTWALIKTATGNQIISCFGQSNAPAGVNTITMTWTVTDAFDQAEYSEWNNISTAAVASVLDGIPQSATLQTTNTVATPAIVTGTSGDLIFQYTTDDGNTTPNTSYTKGTGFTLSTANVWQSNTVQTNPFVTSATQYQVQSAAGSITPSITLVGGTGPSSDTISFALKSAVAGTPAPTGIYICGVQKAAFDATNTALVYQFPHIGNLIAINTYNGNLSPTTITISDSDSHSYTSQIFDPSNAEVRMFAPYVANVAPNTDMTGPSITYSAGGIAAALGFTTLWDICNAAVSPFVQFVHTQGTQSVTGNLTTLTITPTNQNDVIIHDTAITSFTISGLVTPSDANGGRAMHYDFPDNAGGGTAAEDDDAHMAWYNGASTSATTFVLSTQNNTTGVGPWAALATEFTGAAAAAGCQATRTLMGMGC